MTQLPESLERDFALLTESAIHKHEIQVIFGAQSLIGTVKLDAGHGAVRCGHIQR